MRNGCHHPSGVITVYVVALIGRTNVLHASRQQMKLEKRRLASTWRFGNKESFHTHIHTLMLFSAPSPDGCFYRASLQRPLPAEVGGYQFDYEENDTNYLPLFSMVGKTVVKTPLLLASLPIKIEDVNKYIMTSQQVS